MSVTRQARLNTALLCVLLIASHTGLAVERWFKPEHAAAGHPLYQHHCASCHGIHGQGGPDWPRPTADGAYPPPPLNGTGHAWHHPLKDLYATIMRGQGKMPAWEGKLERAEVLAIIAWFQSQWTDEIYNAWARMDRSAN